MSYINSEMEIFKQIKYKETKTNHQKTGINFYLAINFRSRLLHKTRKRDMSM